MDELLSPEQFLERCFEDQARVVTVDLQTFAVDASRPFHHRLWVELTRGHRLLFHRVWNWISRLGTLRSSSLSPDTILRREMRDSWIADGKTSFSWRIPSTRIGLGLGGLWLYMDIRRSTVHRIAHDRVKDLWDWRFGRRVGTLCRVRTDFLLGSRNGVWCHGFWDRRHHRLIVCWLYTLLDIVCICQVESHLKTCLFQEILEVQIQRVRGGNA